MKITNTLLALCIKLWPVRAGKRNTSLTCNLLEIAIPDTPGPANITYFISENGAERDADLIKKGNTIVLHCNVENFGRPKAMKYNWYEGNRRRENESGITLTLEKVGVREATNLYSCNAENAAGAGPNGSISINISG